MNDAAKELGKLGGEATKKKGASYYREISKKGHAARWGDKPKGTLTKAKIGKLYQQATAVTEGQPTPTKPAERLKVCKHGTLLNIGFCKYGCKK
jgi:hypothetical protein